MKKTHRAYEFFITSGRLSFSKSDSKNTISGQKATLYLLGFFSVIKSPLLSLPLNEIIIKNINAGPAGTAECLSVNL